MRRRVLGFLAAPLLLVECDPKCDPPPPPPPTTSTTTTTPVVSGYEFLVTSGDRYSRWDPCDDPITYQIDTRVGTVQEHQAIQAALVAATEATGFTFTYAGASTDGELDPGVEVMLGYYDFPEPTLGQGSGSYTSQLELYEGFAYVEPGLSAAMNRHVLLHEVGHLLGLGHTDDDEQVMFAFVGNDLEASYQPGDREGLRLVGTTMDCFPPSRSIERAPQTVTWSD